MKPTLLTVLAGLVLLTTPGCFGFENPETPAGHEGYVRRGAIVGQTSYYGSQVGPTSTGLGWLLEVENVDVRWQTYSEKFQVMSADNLSLVFSAHVVMRPTPGTIKEVVEVYGGVDWYQRNIREPFRNSVYNAVAGYKALEAKEKRIEIGQKVSDKFNAFLSDKPFEVEKIVVGTINLPPMVAQAQEQKISKQTELEQKVFEIDIEKKKAEIKRVEAQGIADSQKIINETLTPLYLQHEAIMTQEKMASSPNHTVVYIPAGSQGIPLVMNQDSTAGGMAGPNKPSTKNVNKGTPSMVTPVQ